jgi:hypothetical protein
MEPIIQVANTILKHRGVSSMFIFLSIVAASLQVEVNALEEKLTAIPRASDPDVLSYDGRVSVAVQRLTRATFGDDALRATPIPPAFLQPGHRVEGEIYRFIALGDQTAWTLSTRKQITR